MQIVPPRPTNAEELVGDLLMIGSEDRYERGRHHVEVVIVEGQRLSVGLDPDEFNTAASAS